MGVAIVALLAVGLLLPYLVKEIRRGKSSSVRVFPQELGMFVREDAGIRRLASLMHRLTPIRPFGRALRLESGRFLPRA